MGGSKMKVTENSKLNQIISEIRKKQPEINTVYFVGCGASRADLYPAFYFLNNNAKKFVRQFIQQMSLYMQLRQQLMKRL